MPIAHSSARAIQQPHHRHNNASPADVSMANHSPVLGSTPKKTWFTSFFGSYKERQQPVGVGSSFSYSWGSASGGSISVRVASPSGSPVPYTVKSMRPVAELTNSLRQATPNTRPLRLTLIPIAMLSRLSGITKSCSASQPTTSSMPSMML